MARLRFAIRRLWFDRSLTLVALAILALGIGANTALFTVVNAVLLKPLPYPSPDRLVVLRIVVPALAAQYPSVPVNAAHVAAWTAECRACEGLAAIDATATTLTDAGGAQQLDAARVTANFFDFFGIAPALGRGFLPGEGRPGANAVAVISQTLWRRQFGGDRDVIGRAILLDGKPVTVVGVLPAGVPVPGQDQLGDLVRLPQAIDVFRPAAFTPAELASSGDLDYGVVARLRPNVSAGALIAELDALEPAISRQTSDDGDKRVRVELLHDMLVRHARRPLVVLLAATAAVLLIVCVNLANLMLARHTGRRRDQAIRTALGASRRALVLETMTESVVLSGAGGVLGAIAAWALTRLIVATAPAALPTLNAPTLDAHVLLFCAVSSLGAALVIGILPALRNASVNPGDTLKAAGYTSTDGRRGARARRVLVGLQAAIGVALLVMTGLLLVSFVRLVHVDKGFDTAGILTLDLATPDSSYAKPDQWLPFFDAVLARTRTLPGVRAVALTSRLPLRGEAIVNPLSYENDTRPAAARPVANYRYVTPEYFAAIGTPLLRGRTFRDSDRQRQVVVLSASAAAALWPGQDPIGRTISTSGYRSAVSEVIGVAADSRQVDLAHDDTLIAYLPYWLRGPSISSLIVRATVPPASLASAVRQTIREINRGVAIPRVETMEDIVDASVADRRFELSLMLAFGCGAALLAGLGVYGVVSYAVARRGR
ncbi:MAG TPA: ADOP family duplicated permease, partial [Vicinamibacterales bacterium]|nr:ADOP family duplicated permease [Vicinamibacterales bacterium]